MSNTIRTVVTAAVIATLVAVPARAGAPMQAQDNNSDIAILARDFSRYRARLKAAPDARDPELWNWGGPLHATMCRLGEELGNGTHTERDVRRAMGRPDKEFRGGAWTGVLWVPRDEKHLIYWWRGGHDYLYFVVKRGRVDSARWWSALE